MPYSSVNDLGGREYSEGAQRVIHAVALILKSRDHEVRPLSSLNSLIPFGERPLTPKDYMKLYVKAAGVIFETACALAKADNVHPHMPRKNPLQWLRIILNDQTIQNFALEEPRAETELRNIQGSDVKHLGGHEDPERG